MNWKEPRDHVPEKSKQELENPNSELCPPYGSGADLGRQGLQGKGNRWLFLSGVISL